MNQNNPLLDRKDFLNLMKGKRDNFQSNELLTKGVNLTQKFSGSNNAHLVSSNFRASTGDINQEEKREVVNVGNQSSIKQLSENDQIKEENLKFDAQVSNFSQSKTVTKKEKEKTFLSQFLTDEELNKLTKGQKQSGNDLFSEQQKIEEAKLRKMILNVNLEAFFLLQKINERSDGRLSNEQNEKLNQEVRLREKERLKRLIGNKNLSANLIKDKILISCLTLDQQKELIEILQNREELSLRKMIDNKFINHNYLLHQIHLADVGNDSRQNLLEALAVKVEERLVNFISTSYFDISSLLLEINRLSFDGLIHINSRQKLVEMVQIKEEEKLQKMIDNPYVESSDLLKEITLRSDGRLSDNQIKNLIGLVRRRL